MGSKLFSLSILSAALLTTQAFAVKPSWWGGEIQANQGVGFGRYEVTAIPSTGAGSITGFFNLCYTDNLYQNCIPYNSIDKFHFETDIEFTPTGDENVKRRFIDTCLSDDNCTISYPSPWPRDANKNLQAISFNTFPPDNQLYYKTKDFNSYTGYHTYIFVNLPKEVYWEVDGKKILSRLPHANIGPRNYPEYPNFNQKLSFKDVKLVINLWDGSQGGNGGFGGPSNVQQTTGKPAQIQRVAYYPAKCNSEGDCTIDSNPSFLMDMQKKQFIKEGKTITSPQICGGNSANTLWTKITRTDYPVYVSPGHVICDTSKDSIVLYYSSAP